jgi:hypothetical protein
LVKRLNSEKCKVASETNFLNYNAFTVNMVFKLVSRQLVGWSGKTNNG